MGGLEMASKVVVEHNSAGWLEIFLSGEMQAVVDAAGQKIAAEAGAGFEYHQHTANRVSVGGYVQSETQEAAEAEAVDKVLTQAVHM